MDDIELAPGHKTGLRLASPILTAAGAFGFSTEYHGLVRLATLGAFVTNPLTLRPRRPATARVVPLPAGLLLHTGLRNPGIAVAVRRFGPQWQRSPVPIIVHLAATQPEEVAICASHLGGLNRVAAVELGLSDEVSLAEIHGLVRAVRSTGEWPLLVRLPLARAVELAEATALAGADVLTIGAPPRGIVPQPAGHLAGRLYGPGILPLALRAVVQVRAMVSLPIIGAGGIHQLEDVQAFLRSGAQAVQLDSVVWWQPQRVNQIAAAFQKKV